MEEDPNVQVEPGKSTDTHVGRKTPHESKTKSGDARADDGNQTTPLELVAEPQEEDINDSVICVDHAE